MKRLIRKAEDYFVILKDMYDICKKNNWKMIDDKDGYYETYFTDYSIENINGEPRISVEIEYTPKDEYFKDDYEIYREKERADSFTDYQTLKEMKTNSDWNILPKTLSDEILEKYPSLRKEVEE